MKTLNRSVIELLTNAEQNNFEFIQNLDIDSVELNSLRIDFVGTVNYYADSFIDIGYITLFAAAFPIGPIIALLMNALEINNKLIVLLEIYKRPKCEKCSGIFDWMNIWEGLSIASVVCFYI